jgi:mannose/fructose/N-acetylgalactosamine-specific phosphotransferase system component IIB
VDLYLDDRLLHGRILHGWLPVLRPARIVLVARGLAGGPQAAIYAEAAAETGLPLVCHEPDGALPLPAPGDFWLTNTPQAARGLKASGATVERLVIIGLRDAGGLPLATDFTPTAGSLAALVQLGESGIRAVVQRFPGEPAIPVAALAERAGRPEGA